MVFFVCRLVIGYETRAHTFEGGSDFRVYDDQTDLCELYVLLSDILQSSVAVLPTKIQERTFCDWPT